ncbi:MAG: ATP-dependent helicase/nuclease subunit A, partial [Thermoproteota archaeon]
DVDSLGTQDIGSIFLQTIKYEGWLELLTEPPHPAAYTEDASKPWCKFLEEYNKLNTNLETYDDLKNYYDFLFSIKRMPSKPKAETGHVEVIEFFTKMSKLKAYLKKNFEHYQAFNDNLDTVVKPWLTIFKELFNYIEYRYLETPGVTFSDLEYYILLGVQNKKVAAKVLENYNYFIIDEFQDTSFVQFEIMERIIGYDYSKLFCVGDIKQAIYGFKGGEIKVFKNCMENIPKVLELSNNYRSYPNIINFNNDVFDFVFNLGLKYEGLDHDPVDVIYQKVPDGITYPAEGLLKKIECNIKFEGDEEYKFSADELNAVEMNMIYKSVVGTLSSKKHKEEKIAILFKSLKPSISLIKKFIEGDVKFTAQMKISYSEDPILGIFKNLIERPFDTNASDNTFVEFIISAYLEILNINSENLENHIKDFYKDLYLIGFYNSFEKFLYNLGISNSNFSNNLSKIESICNVAANIDEISSLLEDGKEDQYSMEFQNGKGLVTIMTAHASKGLEFDNVYLAGMYTNGFSLPLKETIGKLPGSFKWYLDGQSKDVFKTPWYFYEAAFTKQKDFSEAKRLFYVACSRAKKNLFWVDLQFDNVKPYKQANSWIYAFKKWESSFLERSDDLHKSISQTISKYEITVEEEQEEKGLEPLLFHKDNLGLVEKISTGGNLSVISELSVTKLASLASCPRKFYLKNIYKIEDDDLDNCKDLFSKELSEDSIVIEEKESEIEYESINQELAESSTIIGSSSSSRGTEIHAALEWAIKHNFILPLEEYNKKDTAALNWVLDLLKSMKDDFDFFSEEQIKFSFFGHMISGTPDLVLLGENSNEIWDFKTGRRNDVSEAPYWLQLKTYAYAMYVLGHVKKDISIKLALSYLDEKDQVTQMIGYQELTNELSDLWAKTSKPDQINKDHCEHCQYIGVCH